MRFIEGGYWSEKLTSNREKARGAVKLHRLMLQNGWNLKEARRAARHEYAHAKADSGPGIFGLTLWPAIAHYSPVGSRTREELRIIAFAPGADTNIYDELEVLEGNPFLKVRSLKLPFIR